MANPHFCGIGTIWRAPLHAGLVLLSDGNGRSSYNPDSRAQLNLWSRGKAATAVRQQPTLGLEDCQQWQTWSADDRMDILDAATIARFMNI